MCSSDLVNAGVVTRSFVFLKAPVNNDNCIATQNRDVSGGGGVSPAYTYFDSNGNSALIDGFATGGTGVVEGTPTAIFNDNQIDQITNGASIQFNWSLEKHKFMIGAAIDAAEADYSNTSQLGF